MVNLSVQVLDRTITLHIRQYQFDYLSVWLLLFYLYVAYLTVWIQQMQLRRIPTKVSVATSKKTYLKVFKLTHFSAIAVINETVKAHPLIFIVKTNEDIRSIRAKVLSVGFKPRKSAFLQSDWSYAMRRHFLHTIATCPRSLKAHFWKISSKIDSGSLSIIFASV